MTFAITTTPDMDAETFATALKIHRDRLGLTQAEAASLLEVPARTYWEWEHAKTEPVIVAQEGALRRLKFAKVSK